MVVVLRQRKLEVVEGHLPAVQFLLEAQDALTIFLDRTLPGLAVAVAPPMGHTSLAQVDLAVAVAVAFRILLAAQVRPALVE
jgi:hypothetical protein